MCHLGSGRFSWSREVSDAKVKLIQILFHAKSFLSKVASPLGAELAMYRIICNSCLWVYACLPKDPTWGSAASDFLKVADPGYI